MVFENPILLLRYYKGQLKERARMQVEQWLEDNPVNRLRYEEFIRTFSLGGLSAKEAWKQMWNRLYGRPSPIWLYIPIVIWVITGLILIYVET